MWFHRHFETPLPKKRPQYPPLNAVLFFIFQWMNFLSKNVCNGQNESGGQGPPAPRLVRACLGTYHIYISLQIVLNALIIQTMTLHISLQEKYHNYALENGSDLCFWNVIAALQGTIHKFLNCLEVISPCHTCNDQIEKRVLKHYRTTAFSLILAGHCVRVKVFHGTHCYFIKVALIHTHLLIDYGESARGNLFDTK